MDTSAGDPIGLDDDDNIQGHSKALVQHGSLVEFDLNMNFLGNGLSIRSCSNFLLGRAAKSII